MLPVRSRSIPFVAILPAALLVWRVTTVPPERLWRDWVLIIAGYWALTFLSDRVRRREGWAMGVILYLFGIYVSGQIPLLRGVFAS